MPRPNPIKFACELDHDDTLWTTANDDSVVFTSNGGGLAEVHMSRPDVEMLHAWLGDWLREQAGEDEPNEALREAWAKHGPDVVQAARGVPLVPHEVSRTQDVPALDGVKMRAVEGIDGTAYLVDMNARLLTIVENLTKTQTADWPYPRTLIRSDDKDE